MNPHSNNLTFCPIMAKLRLRVFERESGAKITIRNSAGHSSESPLACSRKKRTDKGHADLIIRIIIFLKTSQCKVVAII